MTVDDGIWGDTRVAVERHVLLGHYPADATFLCLKGSEFVANLWLAHTQDMNPSYSAWSMLHLVHFASLSVWINNAAVFTLPCPADYHRALVHDTPFHGQSVGFDCTVPKATLFG